MRYNQLRQGVPYLSRYPNNYSNASILPVLHPCVIGRHFSGCNSIDNHIRMQKSDLALDKYWVTQSGYFRLVTTVTLGMGLADGKLLFCHGISEQSKDKNISMI